MRYCKACGAKIPPSTTLRDYCKTCVDDPTPLNQIKRRATVSDAAAKSVLTAVKANKRSSIPEGKLSGVDRFDQQVRRKAYNEMVGFALVVCFLIGTCIWVRRWFRSLSSTPQNVPLSTALSSDVKTAVDPKPAVSQFPQRSEAEAHMIQNLGAALTDQYKSTPYEVEVVGDDANGSLLFDCSDDPKSEDVCFMLYKQYPGASERKILVMMGVRRLYFSAGLLKKHWQKAL